MRVQLLCAATAVAMAVLAAQPAPAQGNAGAVRRPGSGGGDEVATSSFFAAEVADDGTLKSGAGAVSARRLAVGLYEVIFSKNNLHRRCWWTATIGRRRLGPEGADRRTIFTEPRVATNNGVFIAIRDDAGEPVDGAFMVVAVCR